MFLILCLKLFINAPRAGAQRGPCVIGAHDVGIHYVKMGVIGERIYGDPITVRFFALNARICTAFVIGRPASSLVAQLHATTVIRPSIPPNCVPYANYVNGSAHFHVGISGNCYLF